MLALPIKAPKAKAASQTVPTRAPKLPQHMPWQPGARVSNQAMLRLLSQRDRVGGQVRRTPVPEARVFPSWNRRGGCAIKKKDSLRSGADGVVSRDETFRNAFLQHSPQQTTPAAPFNGGFAAFS
jgi:hypothetical protein